MWRARTTSDRTVAAVSAAVFVQFAGATAMLPLLPLFLRRQHTTVALVGVVMASYFAAGVLTQYAAGHLADRIGHRIVMIGGVAGFSVAGPGVLVLVGGGGFVGLRGVAGPRARALQPGGPGLRWL